MKNAEFRIQTEMNIGFSLLDDDVLKTTQSLSTFFFYNNTYNRLYPISIFFNPRRANHAILFI